MPTNLSAAHKRIPSYGLLAMAVCISAYALNLSGLLEISAATLGVLFPVCGCLQIMAGLHAGQSGNQSAAAVMLPLGMFCLSLTGFEVFPRLGIGHSPEAATLGAYLTMWALFAAILFLGSFQQCRVLQAVFANLLFCLLFLALGILSENPAFLLTGGICGIICGVSASYTAVAQLLNRCCGRAVFPTGQVNRDIEDQLAP